MKRLMAGAAALALRALEPRAETFNAPPGTHTLTMLTGPGGGGGMEPVVVRNKRGPPAPPRREFPAFCRDPRNLRVYKPNGKRECERRMRQAARAAGLIP